MPGLEDGANQSDPTDALAVLHTFDASKPNLAISMALWPSDHVKPSLSKST